MPYIESKDASKIYYETFGHRKSYPIILIHQVGGNTDIWEHEIQFILKKGFRVIAYELRGHNRSTIRKKRDFTMHDLSDDLHILIDELKIKKCTLIGHSIGGAIASIYAKQYPQNIDAIIFINSASKRIPDKDLEKHHTTRRIAISKGMAVLAEWNKENNKDARRHLQIKRHGTTLRKCLQKPQLKDLLQPLKHCILCLMEKKKM